MRSRLVRMIAPPLIAATLAVAPAVLATDVTVDGSQRHQTIEGLGTCLIAWVDQFRRLYRTEGFRGSTPRAWDAPCSA